MLGKFVQAAITCFAIRPVFEGIGCRGNSTLPQQLARNLLLGEYRSPIRKVIELIWAIKMEYGLTKDEILELYVNRLYLGSGNHGVEMAARDYFGKSAAHLTRAEAAYLAAAIKKPRWNWRQDRPGALKRGRLILELMKREGHASTRDALPGNFAQTRGQRRLHKPYLGHLWQWVRDEIEEEMRRLPDGNYKLFTTLNAEVEIYAERELEKEIGRWRRKGRPVSQGVAVIMRPDGDILAMVGGVGDDVAGRGTNRSKRTGKLMARPPASTFKPFVYLAALEHGLKPDSLIGAEPVEIADASGGGSYRPSNDRGKRYGKVSMREGLAQSINTAAVRLLRRIGYRRLFDTLGRLGVETEHLRRELGLALGSSGVPMVEMVGAYATFANGGRRVVPRAVIAIATETGRILWPSRESGDAEAAVSEKPHRRPQRHAARGGGARYRPGGGRVQVAARHGDRREDRYGRRLRGRVVHRLHAGLGDRSMVRQRPAAGNDGALRRHGTRANLQVHSDPPCRTHRPGLSTRAAAVMGEVA